MRTTALFILLSNACTDPSDPRDGGMDARVPIDARAIDARTIERDAGDPPGTWRSALFPRGWLPVDRGGMPDGEGRFLPDFSRAGFHRGEERPPAGEGTPMTTVDAALGDAVADATSAIQSAIDAACDAGGGIVLLPEGTYRVRLPSDSAIAVLLIDCSNVVLRGEGPARTRILIDDPDRMRSKIGIAVRGSGSFWDGASTTTHALASDVLLPSRTIELADAPSFAAGDWIVVRNDNTDAFRAEHRMDPGVAEAGLWPSGQFRGLAYPRQVLAIEGNTVTLDGPIHDALRTRDNARAYAIDPIHDVGLESFAIGMVENRATPDRTDAESDGDFDVAGTTGYAVHASRAIDLERVRDAWVHDVDSFLPEGNTTGAHVLSIGILLATGAFRITVSECDLAFPQYRGGGGNGYLFHLQGNDVLLADDSAEHARHGFIINQAASGNVLLRARPIDSRYSDDAHRFLANANLYDGTILDRAWLQAVNRGTTSSGAGFTSTMHVFWGTRTIAAHASPDECAVESAQWGHGYLIGSSPGARLCPMSFTNGYWASLDQGDPTDFVEGEGMVDTLFPISLHAAQLALRCAYESIDCVTW